MNAVRKTESKNWHPSRGGPLVSCDSRVSSFESRISNFVSRALRMLPAAFCLLLTAYCLLPTVLDAQGCAMCYTSASAARSTAKQALASGTLILLAPPIVFFALIIVVVYKHRDKFREPDNWRPEHDRELQELLADLAPAKGNHQISQFDQGARP